MTFDLVVVGGGPAGVATALYAMRHGLSAVVLERRRMPYDKACGEGVMPAGVAMLRDLGVGLPGTEARPFAGIRFVDGALAAEGRFSGAPGLGMRRSRLSAALLARAEQAGVRLCFGCDVRRWQERSGGVRVQTGHGDFTGRFLVGADGLHSRVRRDAGLALPPRGRARYGLRRHYRLAPWTDLVEVHFAEGAEAYVTPVGSSEVGVALLGDGDGRGFEDRLRQFGPLSRRLAGAVPITPVRGAGSFRQRVRRRFAGRVALVGDAAGYVDPVTGEGVTLGLRSAAALVGTLAAGRPLIEYEIAWRRSFRDFRLLTEALLQVAARPYLRRRFVAVLARHPAVFDRLVDINAGSRPIHSLGMLPALRLASALLPSAG